MEKSFVELLKKKLSSGEKMSDKDIAAKRDVISDFNGEIKKILADKTKGLKKVTVASDSEEGLKEGLEKAEEVVEGQGEKCEACSKEPCECEEKEMSEEASEEAPSEESPEEKIKRLEKELADLKAKQSPESSEDDIKEMLKSSF